VIVIIGIKIVGNTSYQDSSFRVIRFTVDYILHEIPPFKK
ncbi:hypothetical protein LCGC14_2883410, partial [marine sediment metagenome]